MCFTQSMCAMRSWEHQALEWWARGQGKALDFFRRCFPSDPEIFVTATSDASSQRGPVIACFSAERCFIKKASYTPEAWGHIESILVLEMVDLPFDPASHVSDWNAELVSGRIEVVQAFARRHELHAFVQNQRAKGLSLRAVDVVLPDGSKLGLDLLARLEPKQPDMRLALGLAFASLVFLGSFFAQAFQLLDAREQKLAELTALVSENQAQVKKAMDRDARLRDLEGQLKSLSEVLARPSVAAIWEEVALQMPDDSQALSFDYKDGELLLEGLSPDATRLAEQLTRGQILVQATQSAAIFRDGSGKERFSLSLQIKQAMP
jgi:hypothetical protein